LYGARTSYFHQSIGGYHAAKPAAMQDLFDYQIQKGNTEVLNMLNVKYVIQQDENGDNFAAMNPGANGNAWFIEELRKATNANEEISMLDSLDLSKTAVINTSKFPGVARFAFKRDSTAVISLEKYEPNQLTYRATNPESGLAVFSEMYYPDGWNAYVDGKLSPHFRVNYALRALKLPSGDHTVEFRFEPELVRQGSKITLASSVLLALVVIGGIGYAVWRRRKEAPES
ncbi:MAG: YfhO family protein, partial [Bacteroidota bacterium]